MSQPEASPRSKMSRYPKFNPRIQEVSNRATFPSASSELFISVVTFTNAAWLLIHQVGALEPADIQN